MASDKKKRVYLEEIKTQHTPHWDLDYLSQAELDALYRKNRQDGGIGGRKPKWFLRRTILIAILAGSTAVLLVLILLMVFFP